MRLLLPLLALLLACTQTTLATLDASVTPEGDTSGVGSVRARINFTSFSQPTGPSGNDEKLRMAFTNPEGDSMVMVLSPPSSGFVPGTYTIDGSASTFEASFLIQGGAQSVSVTAEVGVVVVDTIVLSEGRLTTMVAEYQVNFSGGGAGIGAITYQAQ